MPVTASSCLKIGRQRRPRCLKTIWHSRKRHEKKVYGKKSFYWRRDQGLLDVRVPDDDPDPDIVDEDSSLDMDAPPELVMEFAEEGNMARGVW